MVGGDRSPVELADDPARLVQFASVHDPADRSRGIAHAVDPSVSDICRHLRVIRVEFHETLRLGDVTRRLDVDDSSGLPRNHALRSCVGREKKRNGVHGSTSVACHRRDMRGFRQGPFRLDVLLSVHMSNIMCENGNVNPPAVNYFNSFVGSYFVSCVAPLATCRKCI